MHIMLKRMRRAIRHWLDPEYDAGAAEEKTVITLNNEDYELLRKVITNNNLYFLFVNVDDIHDFFFRKYELEHGEEHYAALDDDAEFQAVYEAFRKDICGDETDSENEPIDEATGGVDHE